ncbi:chemotaxis protein CheW [Limnoglobus roseus]|uniref:CheW-like domain-containing protein n=1 Tax=Limnoglobus roseus TaxID=2598579 RepID=A0A5C1A5R5_9BACT|nr:chemotaxis protein CheW [Limnoglobus roseus]QEL13693.1 hypothetical protein PX52LOC_00551 [Limnoglobus roseus]
MIATQTTNLVRLTVGPVTVGLDMDRVLGIERGDRVRPWPDRPDLAGRITNRAGEWPVLNLASRLDLDHSPNLRTGQVVLTAVAGERHGLLIDRVSPITRLSAADVRAVPKSVARRGLFFDGLLMLDGRPLLLLDPDRLAGQVDLFAAEDDNPPPAAIRTSSRKLVSDRLLVIGQSEYPLPGGRVVGFGLPVGCVVEIIEAPAGTLVPGAAEHVREVTEWRGKPLPVIDLAAWCGLRMPPPSVRRVVVIRTATREPVGLLAGPGVRMFPLPLPNAPSRRPITLTEDRVLGVFDTNELTLVIPDLAKLTQS